MSDQSQWASTRTETEPTGDRRRATGDMEVTPEIIYIAGYGRSGSTALDILLGNGATLVSLGEAARIFPILAGDVATSCSCGQVLSCCPFWRPVVDYLQRRGMDDWPKLAGAQRQVEGIAGLVALARGDFSPGGARAETGHLYQQSMRALLAMIAAVSGCYHVVDSSKTTWSTIGRPLALARLCRLNVKLVHLVRDGRAVTWSGCKGTNAALARGRPKLSYRRGYRTALSWALVNLLTSIMTLWWPPDRSTRQYYEDLVARPLPALSRLSRFLDVELGDLEATVARGDSLPVSHLVGGNRFARKSHFRLCADDEWRKKLPLMSRCLYWFTLWPVALLYTRRNRQSPISNLQSLRNRTLPYD